MPNDKSKPDEKPPRAKELKPSDILAKVDKDELKASCGKDVPTAVKTRRDFVNWRITDLGGTP